jgi:cytoskeletal protein RodZ
MLQGLQNIGQARRESQRDSDGAAQQGVGEMLRIRRAEYGLDLRDVSNALRIRLPYLIAIEEGRLDDLPGATYAIGFVRAYADHVGLDGQAVVERYKDETAALANAARLVFPSPLPEGKVPSGKILLFAVLALAVIYGGWVLISSDGRRLAELVPALPERFLALIGMDEAVPSSEAPSRVPDSTPPASAVPVVVKDPVEEKPVADATRDPATAQPETQDATRPMPSVDVETAPGTPMPAMPAATQEGATAVAESTAAAVQPTAMAPEPERAAETTANGQGAETAATKPPEAPAAVAAASEPASADPPTGAQSAVASTAPDNTVAAPEKTPVEKIGVGDDAPRTDITAAITAMDPAPPAPPAAPSEGAKEPRQYGVENTDARIIIRATDDSWVQVRDKEGNLLLTRVLRVGDSYRVPNAAGVVMRTGNAGGLDIQVDGESVPGLGPKGAIRHAVALDAERLKAGTAVRP